MSSLPPSSAAIDLRSVEESLAQENGAVPVVTDQTKSSRVRRGVYSLRGKPGSYMVRLRVPAGILTPDQLDALAAIEDEVGWPLGVHLTTRQGIEIHGVLAERVIPCLHRLEALGITTFLTGSNSVRAVVACPLSGTAPGEAFDVTPYALLVDRHFRNKPLFHQLPRKIKIAFEGCPDTDHVHTLASDIGLRAVNRNGTKGFRVTLGGGLGAQPKVALPYLEFLAATNLLLALESILRAFNAHGNRENRARSRLKWLLEDRGLEWFRAEVEKERHLLEEQGGVPLPALPSIPESKVPPNAPTETAAPASDPAAYAFWNETNVRPHKKSGLVTVTIRVPEADLRPAELRAVAAIARRFAGGIRLTIEQDIVLRHVRGTALPLLYAALVEAGLAANCADHLADVTRCSGADGCLSAITYSRGAAQDITRTLGQDLIADPVLRPLRIRVSGCQNACSHHHAADIGLFGLSKTVHGRPVPHYALLLGGAAQGGVSGLRAGEVPARNVGAAVREALLFYRAERQEEEPFADFVRRVTPASFVQRLAPLAAVPPPEEAPDFYRDLSADDAFKVTAKRGECAA